MEIPSSNITELSPVCYVKNQEDAKKVSRKRKFGFACFVLASPHCEGVGERLSTGTASFFP